MLQNIPAEVYVGRDFDESSLVSVKPSDVATFTSDFSSNTNLILVVHTHCKGPEHVCVPRVRLVNIRNIFKKCKN